MTEEFWGHSKLEVPPPHPTFPPDYFNRQFDRYPEGEERFAAVSAHAAYLLTTLHKERAEHNKRLSDILDKLTEANPLVALAVDLAIELREE